MKTMTKAEKIKEIRRVQRYNRRVYLKALRSGRYKQCHGPRIERDAAGEICAYRAGVGLPEKLLEKGGLYQQPKVVGPKFNADRRDQLWVSPHEEGCYRCVSSLTPRLLGITDGQQSDIIWDNDLRHKTFKEIADKVEKLPFAPINWI